MDGSRIPTHAAAKTNGDTFGAALLYCGVAGSVTFTPEKGGTPVAFTVLAGQTINCRCIALGANPGGVVALW